MRFPTLRYWVSGTAVLGCFMTLYSAWVGFVQMPREAGGLKWLALVIGIGLSLAVWYSLAVGNALDAERKKESAASDAKLHARIDELCGQNALLIRTVADMAAAQPQLFARFENSVTDILLSLPPLYKQRDQMALTGGVSRTIERTLGATLDVATLDVAMTSEAVTLTDTADATVTPAPAISSWVVPAPTVSIGSVAALDREIREKEAAVLKHLITASSSAALPLSGLIEVKVTPKPLESDSEERPS